MTLRNFFVFFLVVCTSSSIGQGNSESRLRYFTVSSSDSNSALCKISLSCFTTAEKNFRDQVGIDIIGSTDTLHLHTNQSGELDFLLSHGTYDLLIYSELTDTMKIPGFTFQIYRDYFFELFLKTKPIHIPEIRYDLGKPVIYCYTDQNLDSVTISVETHGELKFTYPLYNDGWNFSLDTTGKIQIENKAYPYLFWDAQFELVPDYFSTYVGFTIGGENLVFFFDSVLTEIGFNIHERTDFITYWCPQMASYEFVRLFFLFDDSCNDLARLSINPLPENLFRMYMIWQPATENSERHSLILPGINRSGFTVIEWGGMKVESMGVEN